MTQQGYDEYQAMMEEAEREANQASADWTPIPCPRSYNQRCLLCEQVGIHWDTRIEGHRAGDRSDYPAMRGILYTKGNSKELRKFARLWDATRAFYSPIIIVPNFAEVKIARYTSQVRDPLNLAEFGPADGPKAQYRGFWHPNTGRNIFITRNSGDPQNYYAVDFEAAASAVPNPQAVMQLVNPLVPFIHNIVQTETQGQIELVQFKAIKDGSSVKIRFLPWNANNPRMFYKEALWHAVPYKDRMEELGVEITKQHIEAAIAGQMRITDLFQPATTYSLPPQGTPAATPPPQTAHPQTGPEIVVPPSTGVAPPSTTPFQMGVPNPAQAGAGRVPPELMPQTAGVGEPQGLDINALLSQVQPTPETPAAAPQTTQPAQPTQWPCLGIRFDQNDPSCVGGQGQAQCPKLQECVAKVQAAQANATATTGQATQDDDIPF